MFCLCSWNTRGLNNPSKCSIVRHVISSLRHAIVCLQETKVQNVSWSFLRSVVGTYLDKRAFTAANGAAGGLLTCWSSRDFDCSEVLVRDYSLSLRLQHRASGEYFFVTNVYGPPTWEGKDQFCAELAQLKGTCSGSWVICGDFNFTRSQDEQVGRRWSDRATNLFNDMISDLQIIDLPMRNARFTRSSMQREPALARLDRFLISTEWDSFFPMSEVEALPRVTSDHCPIVMWAGGKQRPKCNLFRFEQVWLKREDLLSLVPVWWNEVTDRNSCVLTFTAKLRHCRTMLKQ